MKKGAILTSVAFWVIIAVLVGLTLFFVIANFSEDISRLLAEVGLIKPEKYQEKEIEIEQYKELTKMMIEKEEFNFEVHFIGEIDIKGTPFDKDFDVKKVYSTKTGLYEKVEELTVTPADVEGDVNADDILDIDYIEKWGTIILNKEIPPTFLPTPVDEPTSTLQMRRIKLNERGEEMRDIDGNPITVTLVLLRYLETDGKTIRYRITPGAEIEAKS